MAPRTYIRHVPPRPNASERASGKITFNYSFNRITFDLWALVVKSSIGNEGGYSIDTFRGMEI